MRVISSNPSMIMTDPKMADRNDVAMVKKMLMVVDHGGVGNGGEDMRFLMVVLWWRSKKRVLQASHRTCHRP